jgi:integrase
LETAGETSGSAIAHASSLASFIYALDSPAAREQYPKRLKIFLTFTGMPGKTVEEQAAAFLAKNDIQFYRDSIIKYITYNKQRVLNKELAAGTLNMYYHTIKLFFDMNDITEQGINWAKISRGLPKARVVANDRAPTLEEIRKLMEYADRRMKMLVTVMFSSGIRVGAWAGLQLKHVVQVHDSGVAKLIVYDGENEQYYTFITPEAHAAIKEWIAYRESYGEKITPDSHLMRDLWPTTDTIAYRQNNHYVAAGLATYPKKVTTVAIQKMLNRALKKQGIRQPLLLLKKGDIGGAGAGNTTTTRRHPFKLAHGLRKAFRSKAGQVMHHLNVELIMGHQTTGTQETYWRPTEQEVLKDYLRAVDYLSVVNVKNKGSEEAVEKVKQETDNMKKELAELKAKHEILQANSASVLNTLMAIEMGIKSPQVKFITWRSDKGEEELFDAAAIARAENEAREKEHQRRHHEQ